MRHKPKAVKAGSSNGRNAIVSRLGNLLGVVVMTAMIVALGLTIGYTPAERLLWSIVGGAAGLVAYWIVIKIYWRV